MFVTSLMVFLFLPVQANNGRTDRFRVHLPTRITALSGSCVQIPCTFDAPEDELKNTKTIFGCWIKNHLAYDLTKCLVVFDKSSNITRGFNQIEMLGNLSQHGCTSVFYNVMNNLSDNFYFRVEMKNPVEWKWTYEYSPIYISVLDVPEIPILTPTHLQPVMEKTTVNLSCSAKAPCPKQPPTISWSNVPESANITTQLQEKPNKTQSMFSHVIFKASHIDHRKNISCTATYPRNSSNDSSVETTVMLQVLKANPNEINYTWYKRGQEKELYFGEQLTFNVNNGGWYCCTATNIHGNQTSEEIQLIVAESLIITESLIIGCVIGISAFLLIVLLVTHFLRFQKVKASIIRETDISDQCQEKQVSYIYANSAFVMDEDLEMPKDENDIIHYGEIDFSTAQTKSITEKISGQETIYAKCQEKQVSSIYANSAFVMDGDLEMPKDENDIIHYGEIDFSTARTKSITEKISGQETIYAKCQEKQVSSIYANSAFVMDGDLEMPKDENDIIHYGEIDFSTARTKSITEKISGQETIYAKCQEKQVSSIFANSAFVMDEELEMPKDENDIIHYGEIDFSTAQTKSNTEKISGQETIYAEVCASGKS
ncbi:Myelin-associated glycoprotein [Labeo rohita]|uniref:Myelin-associated glycoprotein n=1 Tax=Labeo rohita TaxID=84645 RepID=A0ABQ8L4N9_LABRO|nr:Myelin-associated glycoprotein [Labeo rohita]